MPLACFALTLQGASLARKLAGNTAGLSDAGIRLFLPARLACPDETPFTRIAEAIESVWHRCDQLVFFAATGLVVRCIAPLVRHKDSDPAVVVCDEDGHFAISLLSGHLGGANELARKVAAILGGTAVITTATDCAGLPAFDVLARQAGCAFADLAEVRDISTALLAHQTVVVHDPSGILDQNTILGCPLCRLASIDEDLPGGTGSPRNPSQEAHVSVSLAPLKQKPGVLRLHPKRIVAGIGCRKGVSGKGIRRAILEALHMANISPLCLAAIASAALKDKETGLHEATASFGLDLTIFPAEELAAIPVPHPSARAAACLDVDHVGVCEASALLAAGAGARLVLPKQIFHEDGSPQASVTRDTKGSITVALALTATPLPAHSGHCPCPDQANYNTFSEET